MIKNQLCIVFREDSDLFHAKSTRIDFINILYLELRQSSKDTPRSEYRGAYMKCDITLRVINTADYTSNARMLAEARTRTDIHYIRTQSKSHTLQIAVSVTHRLD